MPDSTSHRDTDDGRNRVAQTRPNLPNIRGRSSASSTVGGTERTSNLSAQATTASRYIEDAKPVATDPSAARRASVQGGLESTLQGSNVPLRGVEAPIWVGETSRDDSTNPSTSETSNLFYEPQGELLQQQREQYPARTEFNIPNPVVTSPTSGALAAPKRTAGTLAGVKRKSISDRDSQSLARSGDPKRQTVKMSEASSEASSPAEQTAGATASSARPPGTAAGPSRPRSGSDTIVGTSAATGASSARVQGPPSHAASEPTLIPSSLPARKVFPIQIGDKLFRLSGASLSSDAPSYFSQFFEEQLSRSEGADQIRTLYIDRDPATFEDIALHLQGYHVEPRDGPHFVRLFADAQFFSLPRLTAQLYASTIYIRIGDEEFQIPRDLFNQPGDSPNYFSLGFSVFFGSPSTDAFPGLAQRTLLRPPSILPPSVPNRSAKTFADILHFLKGYPVEIRNEEHRQELLRDVRYFHLKGLEQRIIPHSISYNLVRQQSEIVIRLEDIRQSGVSFVADSTRPGAQQQARASTAPAPSSSPGWVFYQRPYADAEPHSLIVEINGNETTFLHIEAARANSFARLGRASFRRQALSRFTSLLTVIANKMALPVTQPLGLMLAERGAGITALPISPSTTGLSEERVKVRISADADVFVDGKRWVPRSKDDDDESDDTSMDVDPAASGTAGGAGAPSRSSKQQEDDESEEWVVEKAQWRLRIQPVATPVSAPVSGGPAGGGGASTTATTKNQMEVILGAVKIMAYSSERGRNAARGFLT